MRPAKMTAAHKTGDLAELVCSNSLKSLSPSSAPGLLKDEMRSLDSLVVQAAEFAKVPAGQALAVDRRMFSSYISEKLHAHPGFTRAHDEIDSLAVAEASANHAWIIATGPLTSSAMASEIDRLSGATGRLHFYDAIAPVIAADSIDMDHCFRGSRYGEGEGNDGDYLNIPMDRDTYEAFVTAIANAEYSPLHSFEEPKYFESCLPIEVMVERGRDTLRFGPMKPVGFVDPKTQRRPWAVIQLRQENREGTMFSMVGFQTKMKWPEQKKVFSMLPALAEADFLRFGSVHRNTYVNSPKVLSGDLSFRSAPRIFLAGQVTGVEGYTESAAIGLLAARFAAGKLRSTPFAPPPKTTMIGALLHYVTCGGLGEFQPMNTNMGLLPPAEYRRGEGKTMRRERQCLAARQEMAAYLESSTKTASNMTPSPLVGEFLMPI